MKKRTIIEIAVLAFLVLGFAIAARLTGGAPFSELLPWNWWKPAPSKAHIKNARTLSQRDALARLGLNGVGLGNTDREMQGRPIAGPFCMEQQVAVGSNHQQGKI
jgi:membrane protein implicated in regulation of membrane protease activity